MARPIVSTALDNTELSPMVCSGAPRVTQHPQTATQHPQSARRNRILAARTPPQRLASFKNDHFARDSCIGLVTGTYLKSL